MTIFNVIDFETTGLDPAVDRVVEIGTISLNELNLSSSEPYEEFYHPGDRGIPPEASAIHHLTIDDVRLAPQFDASRWQDATLNATVLVAHNAAFDRAFTPPDDLRPWICTLKLALLAWPDAPGHSNQTLRYWRDVKVKLPSGLYPHRAAYDALVTAALFRDLHGIYQGDVERMIKISSEPSLLPKVRFGMHNGKRWSEMDAGYLRWILSKDFNKDVKFTAQYWLEKMS